MYERIKALCESMGISVGELERQAGISPRTICHWNESLPSIDKALRVAAVLGVTVDELLRDEQNEQGA